jgi:hypothetical protein
MPWPMWGSWGPIGPSRGASRRSWGVDIVDNVRVVRTVRGEGCACANKVCARFASSEEIERSCKYKCMHGNSIESVESRDAHERERCMDTAEIQYSEHEREPEEAARPLWGERGTRVLNRGPIGGLGAQSGAPKGWVVVGGGGKFMSSIYSMLST